MSREFLLNDLDLLKKSHCIVIRAMRPIIYTSLLHTKPNMHQDALSCQDLAPVNESASIDFCCDREINLV